MARLTHWLTDSLNDSLICGIMLLGTWQQWTKSNSGQTLTRFQAASHLSNAPLRRNVHHVYLKSLKGDISIEVKNHQPFYSDHLCEPVENLLLDEKKKIRTRSLAEAKLDQFWSGFICHPQV